MCHTENLAMRPNKLYPIKFPLTQIIGLIPTIKSKIIDFEFLFVDESSMVQISLIDEGFTVP